MDLAFHDHWIDHPATVVHHDVALDFDLRRLRVYLDHHRMHAVRGATAVRSEVRRRLETGLAARPHGAAQDRKSTRLNSSHSQISYAVFCLKKKKKKCTRTASVERLFLCTYAICCMYGPCPFLFDVVSSHDHSHLLWRQVSALDSRVSRLLS